MKKVLLLSALVAVACFPSVYAAEESKQDAQEQSKVAPQNPATADKQQPQQPSSNQSESQPTAKPSMADYCREHTC